MKKIVCLILLICVVLSLYSIVFLDSRSVNFQEAYTSTLSFITNIGSVFEPLKDIHELTLKCLYVSLNLPDIMGILFTNLGDRISGFIKNIIGEISNSYTNIVKSLANSFKNMWSNILKGFGLSEDDDYIELGPCDICGGLQSECTCHLGDVIPPGTVV